MTASKFSKLLYNGFGIKSVTIKSIDFIDHAVFFKCSLKKPLKKCSKCKSYNVQINEPKKLKIFNKTNLKLKNFIDHY